ncbi:SDR family oxidoreductase [Sphingomonadaceae bacterium G21617-S1]|nr:SDR family oxidoreductase [Sphingomonadaceae bacterium G21617-S1]
MGARLDGKVAIVTGGASGIGRATALLLAERGAAIAVADINADGARQVASEARAKGARASHYVTDITFENQIESMVAATVADLGGLDILVNNAALCGPAAIAPDAQISIDEMTVEIWDRTMDVNLRGTMLCSKHAIRHMLRQDGGAIVNISSIASLQARATLTAYGISKTAVNALTQHIATAFGKRGIRCNAVAPGFTATETGLTGLDDKEREMRLRHSLLDTVGRPEDIANMVAFLASDDARLVTGHVIPVDGGVTVHLPWFADQNDRSAIN